MLVINHGDYTVESSNTNDIRQLKEYISKLELSIDDLGKSNL